VNGLLSGSFVFLLMSAAVMSFGKLDIIDQFHMMTLYVPWFLRVMTWHHNLK